MHSGHQREREREKNRKGSRGANALSAFSDALVSACVRARACTVRTFTHFARPFPSAGALVATAARAGAQIATTETGAVE